MAVIVYGTSATEFYHLLFVRQKKQKGGVADKHTHTHTPNSLLEENRIEIEIEISQLIFLSSHFCSMITSISARCLLSKMDSR